MAWQCSARGHLSGRGARRVEPGGGEIVPVSPVPRLVLGRQSGRRGPAVRDGRGDRDLRGREAGASCTIEEYVSGYRGNHLDRATVIRGDRVEETGEIYLVPGEERQLLCATTEGSDVLWWDTPNPDPDRWPILWNVEFDRHTFNGTLTELLISDLTGALDPQLTAFTVSD